MEPRQSRRADGRGWGGRGDAGRRGDRGRGSATEGAAGRDDQARPGAGRPPLHAADEPPPDREEAARGPGEAPWVRFAEPTGADSASAGPSAPQMPDLSTLLVALEGMRGMVPREISAQLTALVREVLLTLRALIDWYLERLDGAERERDVEDIPID